MMKKTLIAASAAMLLAGMAPAFAQAQKPAAEKMGMEKHHGMQLSAEDRAAYIAARVAALKAVLELTPEQEKHWDALAAVVKANAEARAEEWAERREERAEGQRPNIIEGMTEIANNMRMRADRLTKVAEAAKPLYDSLTEAQKRRFAVMLRETMNMQHPNWYHMREKMMREMQ